MCHYCHFSTERKHSLVREEELEEELEENTYLNISESSHLTILQAITLTCISVRLTPTPHYRSSLLTDLVVVVFHSSP